MAAIETQFDNLKGELEKSEKESREVQAKLDEAQKTIDEANKQRNELNAKIATLKKDDEELRASHSAIDTARAAGEAESADLEKFIQSAGTQLDKKAPKNVSAKAVEDAVKSLDDEISAKQKTMEGLKTQLSTVEEKLKNAQSELSKEENAAADCKKQLNALGSAIKAAQSRVAALKNSINAAIKGGQATEGYFFIKQLKDAAQDLKNLLNPKHEEDLVNQQRESWQKATAAKKGVITLTAERDSVRQQAADAERDYQAKAKSRDADMKASLGALAEGEPQPDGGEEDQAGDNVEKDAKQPKKDARRQ